MVPTTARQAVGVARTCLVCKVQQEYYNLDKVDGPSTMVSPWKDKETHTIGSLAARFGW